jgi:hypothetical protein
VDESPSIVFRYRGPDEVLEHLLKSGAGTAFYDAIDPVPREALTREFLAALGSRHQGASSIPVVHEYVGCIASKASSRPSKGE